MSWLASLPTAEESLEEETGSAPPPVEEHDQATTPESWLEELGFGAEAVREALKEAGGNADEALSELRRRASAQAVGHLGTKSADRCSEEKPKRKRPLEESEEIHEVEGFECRARGSKLLLHLPRLGVDGPQVGKVLSGGSLVFDGVDEWAQELYDASPPRPDPSSLGSFDASAADAALRESRPFVWHDFASSEEVLRAHAELEQLREKGVLRAANAATTAAQKARSDRVAFLDLFDGSPACPKHCQVLLRRLEAAVAALQWSDGGQLLCPRLGMAAVYDGNGASYAAHRDNERTGKARRQWVNFRALTAIAYVNPTGFHDPKDGGQLRCHLGSPEQDLTGASAERLEDVPPRGGTALLFGSRKVLHEVLPSHARRFALTLWFLSPGAGED